MAWRSSVTSPGALAKPLIPSKPTLGWNKGANHRAPTPVQSEMDPLGRAAAYLLAADISDSCEADGAKASPTNNDIGNDIELANSNRLSLVGTAPWR